MQINQINFQEASYPELLREISAAPPNLYVLGELPVQPGIAIVGTRSATGYGLHMTYQMATDLSLAGFVIISGLAAGIDAMAHRAALDAGGKTVAVLAGGLDAIYPAGNRDLAIEILANGGALVSENPVGTAPFKNLFVARNRIISGLAVATLLTEAPDASGAGHTMQFAASQGRGCYAVPGRATDETSVLCNDLIRKNEANCVFSAGEIIQDYQFLLLPDAPLVISARDPRQAKVLEYIKRGHNTTQKLIEAGKFTPSEVMDIMTLLEITGQVRNLGAGQWAVRANRPKVKVGQ